MRFDRYLGVMFVAHTRTRTLRARYADAESAQHQKDTCTFDESYIYGRPVAL